LPAIKIAVGQHQCVRAHFFKKDPVLVDRRMDALDIQIFCLGESGY